MIEIKGYGAFTTKGLLSIDTSEAKRLVLTYSTGLKLPLKFNSINSRSRAYVKLKNVFKEQEADDYAQKAQVRILKLAEVFWSQDGGLRLGEVAKIMGSQTSTALKDLCNLESAGWVKRDSQDRGYRDVWRKSQGECHG